MKTFIGIITVAIVLFITVTGVLWLYGVQLFSAELLGKLLITLAIVIAASILLVIIVPFFFRNYHKGYDMNAGKVAHKKIQ